MDKTLTLENSIIMEFFADILDKYSEKGCFIVTYKDNLRSLCSYIPENLCGVYVFSTIIENEEKILYIGCSGHIENGNPVYRKKHGLKGRIYGKQEKTPRNKFYKQVMNDLGVSAIKVYWFNTENEDPEYIEYRMILKYIVENGEFPMFNNKLERKINKAI